MSDPIRAALERLVQLRDDDAKSVSAWGYAFDYARQVLKDAPPPCNDAAAHETAEVVKQLCAWHSSQRGGFSRVGYRDYCADCREANGE